MVIAIVGRGYSDKAGVAHDIQHHLRGNCERLEMYSTRPNSVKYMSEDELTSVKESDIFCMIEDNDSYKQFLLKSQFDKEKVVCIVVDDPACLSKLPELEQPYVIVYVTCASWTALERASSDCHNPMAVKARYAKIHDSLEELDKSGQFSCGLNTTTLTDSSRFLAVGLFCMQLGRWLDKRKPDEMHMPVVADAIHDWRRMYELLGMCVAEVKEVY